MVGWFLLFEPELPIVALSRASSLVWLSNYRQKDRPPQDKNLTWWILTCVPQNVCDFTYSDRPSHIQADPPTLKPPAFICPNPEKLIAMAFVLIFLAYHLFISDRNYVIITSLFRSEHALFGTWKHEASPPFLFYTWQGPEIELRDVLALGNAPYNILRPSLAFEWSFWIFFFV